MSRRLGAMGQSAYVGLTVKRKGSARAAGPEDATPPHLPGKVSRDVFNGVVRCLPEKLGVPLTWKKPRRVFVNSMSDLFHESVPFTFVAAVYGVMQHCPQHTFQILTKRPERAVEFYEWLASLSRTYASHPGGAVTHFAQSHSDDPRLRRNIDRAWGQEWPLPNVWIGTSAERQTEYDQRVRPLMNSPAAVRFLSLEPLLGPIDLKLGTRGDMRCRASYIKWVIVGGESGPGARPCDVTSVRSIVRQCQAAGVSVFVKQLGGFPCADAAHVTEGDKAMFARGRLKDRKGGEMGEWPEDLRVREVPGVKNPG